MELAENCCNEGATSSRREQQKRIRLRKIRYLYSPAIDTGFRNRAPLWVLTIHFVQLLLDQTDARLSELV